MSLRDEIKEWRQPDGLIVPKNEVPGIERPDTTGNGWLYYSLYLILLMRRGEFQPSDKKEFEEIFDRCEVFWGVIGRSPGKRESEQTAKDDYMGLTTAGKLMGSRLAWRVLDGGNHVHFWFFKWFYKNIGGKKPFRFFDWNNWKAWFGRTPQVIAHFQWCGDVEPHLFRQLWQAAHLALSNVDSASSVIQNSLMIMISGKSSFFMRWASRNWTARMLKRWPGGIKEALAQELEPGHAIVEYWM